MSHLVPAALSSRLSMPDTSWQFRLVHGAGLLVTVPLVAVARLFRPGRHDESIFQQSNRAVLTALELALGA